MNKEQLWQRYQDWLYYNEDLGFYLDISRMGFNDQFVTEMKPKFDKAFADMKALETGAIANPDENRMVGHYWLRNPDLAPDEEIKEAIIKTVQDIKSFSQKIISGAISPTGAHKFTDVLSIGIGGSALGPEFVAEALGTNNSPLKIHFIDNTDPAGIDKILAQVQKRLNTTLVLVISKSGGTPEARNGMIEVQKFYQKHNIDFATRAVAVTGMDMNSKLEATAKEENWLAIFPM